MIAPSRRVAFEALRAIDERGKTAADALEQARRSLADARDRALVTESVNGVLRWRALLDWLIAHVARRQLGDIDSVVLTILRLAAYQRLYLTRVPASAIVHDSVELARASGRTSATGFVNAVARRLGPESRASLPTRPADAGDLQACTHYLSVVHSHPRWLVERWIDRWGADATEQMLVFNNTTPLTCLRKRPAPRDRQASSEIIAERAGFDPARYVPEAYYVHTPQGLSWEGGESSASSTHELHPERSVDADIERTAAFVIQDEGSQLVARSLGAAPGMRVLDACAAPGGKTISLWDDMDGRGQLVAADHRRRRVRTLAARLAAAQCPAQLVRLDARQPLPFRVVFDRVLVDVPCSGLGTLRRDPDVKWRRQPSDLAELAATARRMLAEAAGVVRPGGWVVYATCSTEPEENEHVVRSFLDARPDFVLRPNRAVAAIDPVLLDSDGCLHTLPFRHGLDGFYASVLERTHS